MSETLYGDRFSSSVMEILHIIKLTGANVSLENIDLNEIEKRNALVKKTATITLPFLETKEGNISESKAIDYYLCNKYKPELLGETQFGRAKVNQWIEFACNEINNCNKSIIYPIFGWSDYCKENFDKDNTKIKEHLKIIEKELSEKEYITGSKLTLADVLLFRYLRFLMMFHFPEKMRKSLFPKTEKWFEKIMATPEAIAGYGRTVLCKNPMKAFNGKINRNNKVSENNDENLGKKEEKGEKGEKGKKNKKEKDQEKKQRKELVKEVEKEEEYIPSMLELPRFNIKKKENNPLDALPESKFDLEKFKTEFVNNTNKKGAMRNFWKSYDPEGYSLWSIEYNNEPGEFVSFFRTVIVKGDILLQLEYFKKYCFGVFGVYGSDGDYKIRGCLMWRGNEIPDEIKELNCYNKLTLKKLNTKDKREQQLVHDYWTKIKENEKVLKLNAIDTRYFY